MSKVTCKIKYLILGPRVPEGDSMAVMAGAWQQQQQQAGRQAEFYSSHSPLTC